MNLVVLEAVVVAAVWGHTGAFLCPIMTLTLARVCARGSFLRLRLYVTFAMGGDFLALSWDSHVMLSSNAVSLVESFGLKVQREGHSLSCSSVTAELSTELGPSPPGSVCLPSESLLLVGLTVPHAPFHTTPEATGLSFPPSST